MVLPAVIAAGAALGSAYMSSRAQQEAANRALEEQQRSIRQRNRLADELEAQDAKYALTDDLGMQTLNPADFQYQALDVYRPEAESVVDLGPTAMEGIALDPATRAAQMRALDEMSLMADGGMSAIDQAAASNIKNQIAQAQRGERESIASNMRQRGVSGSGMELAAQLQAQQAAADRASLAGVNEAADSVRRRMAALEAMGQIGGSIRGQDFGEQSAIAGAQDAVSRFNAANRQDVVSRNVGARNAAAESDWRNRQGIANNNTSMRYDVANQNNQMTADQARFRNQANEQRYGRAEDRAGLRSGISMDSANARANAAAQQGQSAANMYSGLGQGIMQGANAYMQYDAAEKDREAKYEKQG